MFSWKKLAFSLSTATAVIGVVLLYKFFRRKKGLHHKIYICSCLEDWEKIEDEFTSACITQKVVGFDCEWTYRKGNRQPIALMQIATARDICVLFRLCKFKSAPPFRLLRLLANHRILKVGIDIDGDYSKLLNDYGILIKGCLDLRYMIELIPEAQHIKGKGLSAISEAVLGEKLNKSREIRCSNWQKNILSKQQVPSMTKTTPSIRNNLIPL
ncbi:exonuclease 3'-5' domain-containing protein 2-like [Centruroides sculpturatus]|uniref:exonuclease 3'-5' domain-containing protein 2-like n=1 Tax=Centruroides sculpturatus TaxID=218467 RepID=UPI000C6CBCD0|nr:exonuclease 3'-5' domain-containing protein 2-like [Centruroides sculpturatus]